LCCALSDIGTGGLLHANFKMITSLTLIYSTNFVPHIKRVQMGRDAGQNCAQPSSEIWQMPEFHVIRIIGRRTSEALDRALKVLKDSGDYQKLLDRYF